jgi:hypothetical protein
LELTNKNPPGFSADFLSVCLSMEAKPQTGAQSLATPRLLLPEFVVRFCELSDCLGLLSFVQWASFRNLTWGVLFHLQDAAGKLAVLTES